MWLDRDFERLSLVTYGSGDAKSFRPQSIDWLSIELRLCRLPCGKPPAFRSPLRIAGGYASARRSRQRLAFLTESRRLSAREAAKPQTTQSIFVVHCRSTSNVVRVTARANVCLLPISSAANRLLDRLRLTHLFLSHALRGRKRTTPRPYPHQPGRFNPRYRIRFGNSPTRTLYRNSANKVRFRSSDANYGLRNEPDSTTQ